MRRYLLLLVVLPILLWRPPLTAQTGESFQRKVITNYEMLYMQLMGLQPDFSRSARVENISIAREAARFDLQEGELYLLTPVLGKTIGAVFLGKGIASITPPTQIEQEQLYRFYKSTTLEKEFTMLFLLFADATLTELQKKLTFTEGEPNKTARDHLEYCLKYLGNRKGNYFSTGAINAILANEPNGFFYAHFSKKKKDPFCFRIDPDAVEEVRLMRRANRGPFSHQFETVCQFHKQADYLPGKDLSNENKDLLKIIHYQIESTIKDNLDFSAVAQVEFTARQAGLNWIYFTLFSDMIVDSVFWDNGAKATYFKHKHNPILWIRCDEPLDPFSIRTIKLFYHGDLIDRNEAAWIYIKNSTGWYPRHGARRPATFELTFHTPTKYSFVSVGKKLSSQTEKKVLTTRWVTPEPIRNASFNIGDYKKYQITDDRIPPVTVYMSEGGHMDIGHALGVAGITSGKSMEKQVGADVANSLAFFQHVFGPVSVEQFYATETPYLHGLAFPGLIHLAWTTFQRTSEKGYDEVFRGHEVAHQWWGIGVDFKTYHDQWLSEGFATYAGLWYMQTALQNNKKFFNILKEYRRDILGNRKFTFGSGQEAGPIWLGYRTQSSKTEGDYNLIIYKKGAWVLHILRNMMLDLKTMNEDKFTNLMRDFYQTFRGKKASTEDFRRTVEKHVGGDMKWFFKQWVYGTDLPTYRYSYRVQKQEDGKYLLHLRVKQENVPGDFAMYMNLKVDFGKKRYVYLRVFINKPEEDIALPLMPIKPKKLEFNALESVLCEVKHEKWK